MKTLFKSTLYLILLFAFASSAMAQVELRRQKNTATRIVFPIRNSSTGATITGATGLDCEIDEFSDGANPTGFTDCTNEATEIGSTGIYYVNLTASETNTDYAIIQEKSSSSNAVTATVLINTKHGTVFTDSSGNLSGSVGSLGTTAKADVNAEVDSALDTAVPGSPTTDSINDRVKRLTAPDGNVAAATSTTIDLAATASSTDNYYANNTTVLITVGTGVGQARCCKTYTGSTRRCTVDAWTTNPSSSDSKYVLVATPNCQAGSPPTAGQVADAVWDELRTDHTTSGTFGQGSASVQGNVTGSVGSVTGAVGSVTGAVGSVTGAVGSVTAGVTLANSSITNNAIATSGGNKIADMVLRRNSSNIEASSDGDTLDFQSLYGAVAKQTNTISVSGGTLTIYKRDGVTSFDTQSVTTSAGAAPITGLTN